MGVIAQILRLLSRRQIVGLSVYASLSLAASIMELFGIGLIVLLLQSLGGGQPTGIIARLSGLVDVFAFEGPYRAQLNLIAFLLIAYAARLVLALATSWLRLRLVLGIQQSLVRRMFHGVLAQPYATYAAADPGGLLGVLTNVTPRVARGLMNGVLIMATEGILTAAIVVALLVQQPGTTAVVVAGFAAVYVLSSRMTHAALKRNGAKESAIYGRYNTLIIEAVRGFREIRIHDLAPEIERRVDKALGEQSGLQRSNRMLTEVPRHVIEAGIVYLVLGIVAFHLLRQDPVASFSGGLLVMAVAIGRLLPSANRLSTAWNQVVGNRPALDDVDARLAAYGARQPHTPAVPLPLTRELAFEDVSFSYDGATQPALSSVNLVVPARKMIGIIGGSGSGKTTFLELAAGLLRPVSGQVRVDDTVLDEETARGLRQRIGYVPQSTFLFDGSIADNIVFGRQASGADGAVSANKLMHAIEAAALGDLIAREPDGVDAPVGDGGERLSGGERQRIGIARALYDTPDILLLDEATSALDVNTEALVLDAIHRLRDRMTVIVVAHRLSAVAGCDTVHWLDRGTLRMSGSYADVVAAFRAEPDEPHIAAETNLRDQAVRARA